MDIIFCKGKSLMSDLIASIDETDVSHVALSSSRIADGTLVFHSVSSGVKISSKAAFKRKYEVKRIYRLDAKFNDESSILWNLISDYEDRPYDYLAIAYLGLYLMLSKIGIHLPKKNIWNNRNHFICTEFVTAGIFGATDSMISLKGLETKILERAAYERVTIY